MENEFEDGKRDHVVQVNREERKRLHATLSEEDTQDLQVEVNDRSKRLHVEVDEKDKESRHTEMDENSSERLHVEIKEESVQDKSLQLHVNSAILAANSEYFMSLFCNGMSESSSKVVFVQVTEEGELSCFC